MHAASNMSKAPSTRSSHPRRAQVAHACENCRGSKVKCSGERPACTRCHTRGFECQYEVLEEGVTMRESLKRELRGNRRQLENAQAILDVMRFGTDMVATEILARLRLGMDLKDVLDEYGAQFEQQRQSPSDSKHSYPLDCDRTGASPPLQSGDGKTTTITSTHGQGT